MWNSISSPLGFCQPVKIQTQNVPFCCKVEEPDQKILKQVKTSKNKQKRKKMEDEEYEIKRHYSTKLVRWSPQQDIAYIQFMLENKRSFESQNLRRTGKVFMQLSKVMEAVRTPNQCKSHHQKMQKATPNGTIFEIIKYLQKKHGFSEEDLKNISSHQSNISTKAGIEEEENQDIEYHEGYKINYLKKQRKQLEIEVVLFQEQLICW